MSTYRIKPLDWKSTKHPTDAGERVTAGTPFGHYEVCSPEYMSELNGYPSPAKWNYCFDEYYDEESTSCDSFEAGKAAAEAHWRERLSGALEEVTSPPTVTRD